MQKPKIILNDYELLIHKLLFNKHNIYDIDLDIYTTLHNKTQFRDDIRNILKQCKINIIDDRINYVEDKTIWRLEIKK